MIAGVLEIQIMAGLARISEDMRKAERIVGDSMAKVEKSARNARSAMETLTAGFGTMMALQQIKQMSDGYTKLDAQLRLSTRNQKEYNQALADVQRISTVAQTNIGATSMLYTRMMNVTRGMNIEQSKIATVAETVSYGLKAYGATAAEASSASLQLSQAMGANRLGGEEFRAVMEAMPNVMKVLADSMGVPLGQLRQLSIDGKITTDVMLKAFSNPEIAAMMRRAAEQTRTIGGELVVMSNNAMQFVGSLMKLSGAQGGAIGAIGLLSEALKLAVTYVAQITSLLLTLAAVYAGKYVMALMQARVAVTAMTKAGIEILAATVAQERAAVSAAKTAMIQAGHSAAGTVVMARNAVVTAEASAAALVKAKSDNAAAAATLKHAQANVGLLTGMAEVKVAEAQLLATTNALTAATNANSVATERQIALQALMTGNVKLATTARAEYVAATAAATVAEAHHAQATMTWMTKLRAFAAANMLGLIGLALWGIYTVADQLGWIDKLSNKLGDFFNTQEASARRLKALAGGGTSGDVMKSAIEKIAAEDATAAAMAAQREARSKLGVTTDVTDVTSATAAIAQLQAKIAEISEGGISPNGIRMRNNLQTEIRTLKEYAEGMRKVEAEALADAMKDRTVRASFSSEWLAASNIAKSDTAKLEKLTELRKLYEAEVGKFTNATALVDRLETERRYKAKIADINKPDGAGKAVPGMSMAQKLAEEMAAKNIRDTSAMTNVQKTIFAWEEAQANIKAARDNNATAAQIANMEKARGTEEKIEAALRSAAAADADLEAKRSVDRVKDIDKIIAAREKERDTYGMNTAEIAQYNETLLVAEQTRLWILHEQTDDLKLQAQYMAEIAKLRGQIEGARKPTPAEELATWKASPQGRVTDATSSAATSAFFMDNGKSFTDNFANSLKKGLEPAFQKLIATLILNTFVLEKSTATETALAGDIWMAIIALISTQFGNEARKTGSFSTLTATDAGAVAGTKNEMMQLDSQWFTAEQRWNETTRMSVAELNKYSAAISDTQQVMSDAGDALGYADTSAKSFNASVNTSGDVTTALIATISQQLLPALVLFQREGENLAQTAERLTDTFKATGDFITALGVSSNDAFGGMGLQSAAAREELIAASGGLSEFTSNSKSFVDNFLTEAEKLAPAADEVARTFDRLGIVGVSTNEQFAQLVKEQMALGNTSVVGELLSVAGAFDSLTGSAAKANEQINGILAKETFSTMVDWLRASKTGGSAAALIATASVGLDTTLAGEQAGTAAFTAANSAAIAAALVPIVTVKTDEETIGVSKFDEMWSAFTTWLDEIKKQEVANWVEFRKNLTTALEDIKKQEVANWVEFFENLFSALDEVWLWIKPVWDAVVDLLGFIWEGISSLWNLIKDMWNGIVDALGGGISSVTGGSGDSGGGLLPGPGNWTPGIRVANGGAFGAGGTHAFADGSAFTNGLYSSPTPFMFANGNGFSNGVMGEAGPEAVMPLKRDSSGRLGVAVNGGGNSGILTELQAMRNELVQLRAESRSERAALVGTAQRTERIIDKWDHNGMPEVVTI